MIFDARKELPICPGEVVAFTCRARGASVTMYSPPFVTQDDPISFFPSDNQDRGAQRGQGSAILLSVIPDAEDTTYVVQMTIVTMSNGTMAGNYTVFCDTPTDSSNLTYVIFGKCCILCKMCSI